VRDSFEDEMGGLVQYTGTYAYRGLLDLEQAVEKVGDFVREPAMWMGKDKVSDNAGLYEPSPV
jgi:salicylate hydroxylase